MRLGVVYATVGRPDLLTSALECLKQQARRPDQIVISAVSPSDVSEAPSDLPVRTTFSGKGLPIQRNAGLKAIREMSPTVDVVTFFDDDFAPAPGYLATVEAIFSENPQLAGVTGNVIADGINGPGYTFDQAQRFLDAYIPDPLPQAESRRLSGLYGCNMSIRMAMTNGIEFDEALPLYGWQEDIDYTAQLARRGALIWSSALGGVHLGAKRARMPGMRTGYSQIANPIYLWRKRTMSSAAASNLMARNVAANLIRSIKPEPWCDRRGRLAGNLRALGDLITRRLHPRNILDLK